MIYEFVIRTLFFDLSLAFMTIMTIKTESHVKSADSGSLVDINGGSTLHFFIKQLECAVAEAEKSISFKSNLLKWVSGLINEFSGY